MTILIEKGIPFEEENKRNNKYPFHEMDCGDSIFAPGKWSGAYARTVSARMAPKKFKARKVEGGWRIWRTA